MFHERIGQEEWQDLFCNVHAICSWDEKGPNKLLKALKAQVNIFLARRIKPLLVLIEDNQQLLREYSSNWTSFHNQCKRFSNAFQQLDLATKSHILSGPSVVGIDDITKTPQRIDFRRKPGDSTVRTLMLKSWNDVIVSKLDLRLQVSAIDLISDERKGHLIDPQLISNLRHSFASMDSLELINFKTYYMDRFREAYILEIEIFYSARASEYIQENGALKYTYWASKNISEEEKRAETYLDPTPEEMEKILAICTRIMVSKFTDQLVNEISHLMEANQFSEVEKIFNFLSLVDDGSTNRVLDIFHKHIIKSSVSELETGQEQNRYGKRIGSMKDLSFVQNLLNSYAKFHNISLQFQAGGRAMDSVNKAFSEIINDEALLSKIVNSDSSSPDTSQIIEASLRKINGTDPIFPEMAALYFESLLRNSSTNREHAIDGRLIEALRLVQLIKDKSSFVKFYKIFLTRRLLLNATIGLEKEEELWSKFRSMKGMPMDELNKIMRMFKDMKLSEEFQQKYMKSLDVNQKDVEATNNNNNNDTVQALSRQMENSMVLKQSQVKSSLIRPELVDIRIINPSCWPSPKNETTVRLPPELSAIMVGAKDYYYSQYQGRILNWSNRLSNGIIIFRSDRGEFDLCVTATQFSILASLDGCVKRTFQELLEDTQASVAELKRSLWVSCCSPG